jgi:hypothetical protein
MCTIVAKINPQTLVILEEQYKKSNKRSVGRMTLSLQIEVRTIEKLFAFRCVRPCFVGAH